MIESLTKGVLDQKVDSRSQLQIEKEEDVSRAKFFLRKSRRKTYLIILFYFQIKKKKKNDK